MLLTSGAVWTGSISTSACAEVKALSTASAKAGPIEATPEK